MKTILYNPIFINPQAYYVFPRLTRYLQPDNESTSEPANYIGTIEVKVIAYGDTTLKRTYTNTDSIDLSEFKNTWIRISLFTKVGSCVLGEWKIGNMESDLPYIDPEVLASLKAVVIVGNKTNNDSDRAIVKNLVDASNPFVISNASFKLNSGFGKYGMDFLEWKSNSGMNFTSTKLTSTKPNLSGGWLTFRNVSGLISETKVKVSGAPRDFVFIGNNNGTDDKFSVTINNGVYTIPEFTISSASGFYINNSSGDWSNLVIEQIPSFEGAFVTDGIDDLITSTKTVQEMGITDEVTVVSMIHQIDLNSTYTIATTNYIENSNSREHVRSDVYNYGKTGIYGYSASLINNTKSDIKNILGDEADYYVKSTNSLQTIFDAKFSVVGRISELTEASQVAWYWTIIANKVLTTDEINQVIAYYNLDRTLKPDMLCNVKKQGITNENHAEFGDKLIDFSGNGRDIQLNNLAWKGGSGIAAKPFETIKDYTIVSDEARQKLTIYNEFSYKVKSNTPNHYWTVQSIIKDNTSYQVTIITDKDCYWINSTSFTNNEGNKESIRKEYPVKANTPTQVTICGLNEFEYPEDIEPTTAVSYVNLSYAGEVTVTFIPSCKGGLLLDGVNDFGKVTGMPIYKDYTFIIDREIISIGDTAGIVASKSEDSTDVNKQGAFLFEYLGGPNNVSTWSFYKDNGKVANTDFTRGISYQSKYSYNGIELLAGTAFDSDKLWLGTVRDKDSRFANVAIYSLMSFPYSMSEFLIERQLKKHKLGTLYPDMVEFRPVIKSNASYDNIVFYYKNEKVENGTYLTVGSSIGMHIRLSSNSVNEIKSITINGIPATFNFHDANNNIYQYNFNLTSKSPQKINITIDEYIRYEDIKQPYPVIFQVKDRHTSQIYNYGDKIKVGSSIQLSQGEKPNLLSGLYSIQSYEYEGKTYSYNQLTNLNIILTKQSISLSCNKIWLLDDNEPKCILSPRLLRIPNSSYKILGHIPDISGHGNHGKINNSAYAGMSGVNGYPVVFGANKTWANESNGYVTSITSNTIHITNVLNAGLALLYSYVKYNGNLQNIKEIPPFKIEIKGLEGRSKFIYKYLATSDATKETNLYLGNGTHELPKSFLPTEALINNAVVGFSISPIEEGVTNFLSDITIKVLPEYEGAYCLDGVDDFVTIPTTVGGKQVLMKVNWDSPNTSILYDQRGYNNEFAIYNGTNDSDGNPIPAYQGRNNGQTYIDGILNSNIKASELRAITHNITITNELSSGANKTYPIIGSSKSNAYFVNMALYDFMLFDEISTDDKILELNEYVGIEGNTE